MEIKSSTPAWQAKLTRAEHHLDDIKRQVDDYLATEPCTVIEEAVEANSFRARLALTTPPPDSLLLTIGDCVHNTRSALDALAYDIAKAHFTGEWDEGLERAPSFPICSKPGDFADFFKGKRRSELFDPTAQAAFRDVQPFALHERVGKLDDVDPGDYAYNALIRLNRLWNIDKHRRIPVVAFKPGLMSWGADGEHKRGIFKAKDDDPSDIVCYVYDDPETKHLVTEINYDLQLQLGDDPSDLEVVKSLQYLYNEVNGWVIPSILDTLGMPRP